MIIELALCCTAVKQHCLNKVLLLVVFIDIGKYLVSILSYRMISTVNIIPIDFQINKVFICHSFCRDIVNGIIISVFAAHNRNNFIAFSTVRIEFHFGRSLFLCGKVIGQ